MKTDNKTAITTKNITDAMKHPAPLAKRDGKGLAKKLMPKVSDNGNIVTSGGVTDRFFKSL